MSQLRSTLDPKGDTYTAAASAAESRLEEIDAELAKALAGGGAKYVERHHDRGKLTARERIELLVDADSPFLELSPLAAYGSAFQVGASLVTGIGAGERCGMHDRRQRPDGQGRHQQSVDISKGSAGQADRAAEPAPGDFAGGIRRRGSAHPERDLRSWRPVVPRPDPAVGGRVSRPSRWCSATPPRAAPTCPGCPITW